MTERTQPPALEHWVLHAGDTPVVLLHGSYQEAAAISRLKWLRDHLKGEYLHGRPVLASDGQLFFRKLEEAAVPRELEKALLNPRRIQFLLGE